MGEEHPWWCYKSADIVYEKLDPGIREVVRFLVKHGFDTTDSGDGVSKLGDGVTEDDILPSPHVFMQVAPAEISVACHELVGLLKGIGIRCTSQTESWMEFAEGRPNTPYIESSYDPIENVALLGLFHVTSDMIPAWAFEVP